MTKQVQESRLIPLGAAKAETKGASTDYPPDNQLQRKPIPGLSAD